MSFIMSLCVQIPGEICTTTNQWDIKSALDNETVTFKITRTIVPLKMTKFPQDVLYSTHM
jgi:hypothetical protein